jgi:hypothetical protein
MFSQFTVKSPCVVRCSVVCPYFSIIVIQIVEVLVLYGDLGGTHRSCTPCNRSSSGVIVGPAATVGPSMQIQYASSAAQCFPYCVVLRDAAVVLCDAAVVLCDAAMILCAFGRGYRLGPWRGPEGPSSPAPPTHIMVVMVVVVVVIIKQTADTGQQTADSKQQTASSKQ